MTNGQNVARARHLEDVANASKRYILAEILDVTQAVSAELENITGGASYADFTGATFLSGGSSGLVPAPHAGDENKFLRGDGAWATVSSGGGSFLDTVPVTVDGGLWYELSDGVPILKLRKGNYNYTFANAKAELAKSTHNYLSVWLRFNQSATYDECGHTFTAVGSPTISATNAVSGNALQVSAADYITCTDGISLGGQDFTIDCWFRCETQFPSYEEIFFFGEADNSKTKRISFMLRDYSSVAIALVDTYDGLRMYYDAWRTANGIIPDDNDKFTKKRFHAAMVYRHAERKMYCYLNGKCFLPVETTLFQSVVNHPLLKVGGGHTSNTQFAGTIDEFRIHNGVALWTSDFTPPTAADYA